MLDTLHGMQHSWPLEGFTSESPQPLGPTWTATPKATRGLHLRVLNLDGLLLDFLGMCCYLCLFKLRDLWLQGFILQLGTQAGHFLRCSLRLQLIWRIVFYL